jgi:hypothetical protein
MLSGRDLEVPVGRAGRGVAGLPFQRGGSPTRNIFCRRSRIPKKEAGWGSADRAAAACLHMAALICSQAVREGVRQRECIARRGSFSHFTERIGFYERAQ